MSKKYNMVALLPMKLHSERIKGKNFKLFAGKPLFLWILDSLLAVDTIDKIVINTDARDLLKQNGIIENDRIIIRDRKAELCGDKISMNWVLSDDIENVDSNLYLMTHTTNPLLRTSTIEKAIVHFKNHIQQNDSLFMVNKVQTRFYREDMTAVNHDPDNLLRTQDLEVWYEENSCMYIFTKNSFKKTNGRIGAKPKMFVTPILESIDIDEQENWIMAESLALYNKSK